MWALVTDNTITKIINNPKGLVIDNIQYSRNIFSFRWSNEEREAIGLYEVVWDNTNKKDEAYYINTNASYAFADGVVTASYGSATAKAHADILFTAADDLNSVYPAKAAREMGWNQVPLICAREIPVSGGLSGCIRVLIHWNTNTPQSQIRHVYLGAAASLRPDLSGRL